MKFKVEGTDLVNGKKYNGKLRTLKEAEEFAEAVSKLGEEKIVTEDFLVGKEDKYTVVAKVVDMSGIASIKVRAIVKTEILDNSEEVKAVKKEKADILKMYEDIDGMTSAKIKDVVKKLFVRVYKQEMEEAILDEE